MPIQPIHVPARSRNTGSMALTSPPTEDVTIHGPLPTRSRANGNRLDTRISRFIGADFTDESCAAVGLRPQLVRPSCAKNMMRRSPSHDSLGNKIPSALDHVHEIAIRGRQLAVFLDYDGTLTPIVNRPEQAVLADSTRRVLRTLAAQVPVAILSGRDLEDVRRHVNIDGIVYAGSHGFDVAGPRGLRKQVATAFLSILDAAEKELGEKLAGVSGAVLERKRLSIAVHYRQADKSGAIKVEQTVNEAAGRHRELRMIAGKKVYELQPNIDWHKGKALIWLLDTLGLKQSKALSLYIGDDLTDEDAFRTLRQLGIGIVVSEQPRSTAAHYALKSPAEVERFLREISADLLASADSQPGST